MRGKKAKMLRKLARKATVGQPERKLLEYGLHIKSYGGLIRTIPNGKGGNDIIDDGKREVCTYVNDPKSTRRVYRTLKKMYKNGQLHGRLESV